MFDPQRNPGGNSLTAMCQDPTWQGRFSDAGPSGYIRSLTFDRRGLGVAGIELEDVGKVYPDGTRAVSDIDLDIRDGEFMVLVGPSGCGKTTALRMVAGLEEISEGTVRIGDRVVNDLPARDRDIAMVFQNYALYPHMSVYDNMHLGLKLRKVSMVKIDRRVMEAASILGLADFVQRGPRALSGGQRQRVAMGRAIGREPQAFLMDEPLSNLDAKLRVQTRSQIATLQADLGTTTVYVTHDQVEAMTMGHRVAVLDNGVLQQVDTPRGLLRPAGQRVRGRLHRLPGDEHQDRSAHRVRRQIRRDDPAAEP